MWTSTLSTAVLRQLINSYKEYGVLWSTAIAFRTHSFWTLNSMTSNVHESVNVHVLANMLGARWRTYSRRWRRTFQTVRRVVDWHVANVLIDQSAFQTIRYSHAWDLILGPRSLARTAEYRPSHEAIDYEYHLNVGRSPVNQSLTSSIHRQRKWVTTRFSRLRERVLTLCYLCENVNCRHERGREREREDMWFMVFCDTAENILIILQKHININVLNTGLDLWPPWAAGCSSVMLTGGHWSGQDQVWWSTADLFW